MIPLEFEGCAEDIDVLVGGVDEDVADAGPAGESVCISGCVHLWRLLDGVWRGLRGRSREDGMLEKEGRS